MKQRRVPVLGLAVLAALIAVALWPRVERPLVIGTVPVGTDASALAVSSRLGRVYVASLDDGTISILDGRSGRRLAITTAMPNPVQLLLDDDTERLFVFFQGIANYLDVLDARSGALLASPTISEMNINDAVLDASRQHVFVVASYGSIGHVYMLSARNGAVERAIQLGQSPSDLAVDRRTGRIFVARLGPYRGYTAIGPGLVSMLDARDEHILHTVTVTGTPGKPVVDGTDGRVFVISDTWISTGPLTSTLTVLDASTGRILRSVPIGRYAGNPIVDEQRARVFVASSHGLLMFDARSGRLLRTLRTEALGGIVTLDDRRARLAVLSANATSVAIVDTRTGALIKMERLSNSTYNMTCASVAAVLDAHTGRLNIALSGPGSYPVCNPLQLGQVSVVDINSGTLLHTVTVGLRPSNIAIDEQAQRVFVANYGCPSTSFPCGPRPTDPLGWMPSWLRGLSPWRSRPTPVPTTATMSVLDASR